jgi:glycosyltransferase involved in cell wall biosynthesis
MSTLSIIIPAHNEEQVLCRTLEALQTAVRDLDGPAEIIVVDDASTDATGEIARHHDARVVRVDCRQIAATRNAGARVAQGDRLVFVDADTLVPAGTLRAAFDAMHHGAVGGGCRVDFDGWMPVYARALLVTAIPMYRWLGLAAGCFLFCTRAAFDAVGGFDERLYASEEITMSRALRRHGRFVLLRQSVITSGRKLRTHTAGEVLGTLVKAAISGGRIVRRRERLDVWYGPRRSDPEVDHEGSRPPADHAKR